jgi:hypothetical protein
MDELDLVWSQMLTDAGQNAAAAGRHAVAEYLRLKVTNDAIRSRGVAWLIDAFVEAAAAEQAAYPNLKITREEPHRFDRGQARMVGSLLEIRHGVRCLTVAAGWARTPADGIMRGGALAIAHIRHFGIAKANEEVRLVHGDDLPQWLDERDQTVGRDTARRHIDLFLER